MDWWDLFHLKKSTTRTVIYTILLASLPSISACISLTKLCACTVFFLSASEIEMLMTLRIRLAFAFIASLASLSAFVVSLSHTTGARPNELKSPNQIIRKSMQNSSQKFTC